MASSPTVRAVEDLLGHFDNALVGQFQAFLALSLDKRGKSVAQTHDIVFKQLHDIVYALQSGSHTAFIKTPMILQIFTKFHQMILKMTKYWTVSSTKKANKLKRDNDLKWKMMCDVIEQLFSFLHKHDLMPSAFVWTEIIQNRLLQRTTEIETARNAIILCRP